MRGLIILFIQDVFYNNYTIHVPFFRKHLAEISFFTYFAPELGIKILYFQSIIN